MKIYYTDRHSDRLIVFFAGWGCDEHQFVELTDQACDSLILFDYDGLDIPFDFSKYKEIDVIAYSAGVFVSSLFIPVLPHVRQRVAVNGNPYLFDEQLGLSERVLNILKSVNLDNYMEFRRQYMVETDEDFDHYNRVQSLRSVESCARELAYLQKLYAERKKEIRSDFDKAVFSGNEPFFNLKNQKEFFADKIKILSNERHHLFFRFTCFDDLLRY